MIGDKQNKQQEKVMSDDEMLDSLQQKTADNLRTLEFGELSELLSSIAIYTGWNKLPGSEKKLKTKIAWLQEQIEANELGEKKEAVFRECIRIYDEVDVIQHQNKESFQIDHSMVNTDKTLDDAIHNLEQKILNAGHKDKRYLAVSSPEEQVVNEINTIWSVIINLLKIKLPETYGAELKRLIEVTDSWLHEAGVLFPDVSFMSLSPVAVADSSNAKKKLADLATKIKYNFPETTIK